MKRGTTRWMRPANAAVSPSAASSRSSDHLSKSEKGKTYVITSIEHSATEPGAYETGESSGEDYFNTFTCIPDGVTFRPARITPKPAIQGSQTAVVVGPAGEEIYPDKYGRVKVQFYWDREGKRDEKSSCWIRCAQSIAGKGWGAMFIPRIGQEVVVSFLEGDPDRPLITGVVYNADQMPPYTLPDEKTKSSIKTNSSKGGGGSNEIRFDDDKGSEQIFIHAQKNQDTVVENDETVKIGGNRTETWARTRASHRRRPHRKRGQGREHHYRRRPHGVDRLKDRQPSRWASALSITAGDSDRAHRRRRHHEHEEGRHDHASRDRDISINGIRQDHRQGRRGHDP